ncbi:MAG: HAD family hydrolase [Malacoplasma sp.]|nr:HAD family hydrolase [Malacoplasma sp.]
MDLSKRNLVVCDLDGSLLKDDQTISQFTTDTIKKYVSLGNKFCIATGRPIRAAMQYYNQLGLDTIMANLNGSILSNPSDKSFSLINLCYSREQVKYLLSNKSILKHVGCIFVETIEDTYLFTDQKNSYIRSEFLSKFHVSDTEVSNAQVNLKVLKMNQLDQLDKDINTILLYLKDKNSIDYISFKIKGITNTLVVRSWSLPNDFKGTVIEIVSIFSNKGSAIKYLSTFYMVPLSQIYTFGDGENDLDMLTKSIGYAMKNSSYTVKLLTNKITKKTNNEDGIAHEMKRIFHL